MPMVVFGFFVLVVLPPVLMATAHLYAIKAQDSSAWYVVSLDPRVHSIDRVIADQTRRYKLKVVQQWDSKSAKGYSAFVGVRQVDNLRQDRRVLRVEPRDEEDPAV